MKKGISDMKKDSNDTKNDIRKLNLKVSFEYVAGRNFTFNYH